MSGSRDPSGVIVRQSSARSRYGFAGKAGTERAVPATCGSLIFVVEVRLTAAICRKSNSVNHGPRYAQRRGCVPSMSLSTGFSPNRWNDVQPSLLFDDRQSVRHFALSEVTATIRCAHALACRSCAKRIFALGARHGSRRAAGLRKARYRLCDLEPARTGLPDGRG